MCLLWRDIKVVYKQVINLTLPCYQTTNQNNNNECWWITSFGAFTVCTLLELFIFCLASPLMLCNFQLLCINCIITISVDQGLSEYVTDLWNLADWFTNGCFISWIILRFTSCYIVSKEIAAGQDPYTRRWSKLNYKLSNIPRLIFSGPQDFCVSPSPLGTNWVLEIIRLG